jgi:SAM-dependent methyltransferase
VGESLSEWLALRQDSDFAARSAVLTNQLLERLAGVRPLRIVDLGTGTGSNIKYLAPRLGGQQHWLAVDKDPRLLAEAADSSQSVAPDLEITTRVTDLGALDAPEIFDGRHLVTASALLDLVSGRWLEHVASECRRVGACALFTLCYNGCNECDPEDPDDRFVFDAFNRHQLTDKGLAGPAAGPGAIEVARRVFLREGFEVVIESSDWRLGPEQRALQRQLIDGWRVAAEVAPAQRSLVEAWKERRLEAVRAGQSRMTIGHHDLLAYFATPLRS